MPTFLCGGGASTDFYHNIFSDFEKTHPPFRIKLRSQIVPDDIRLTKVSKEPRSGGRPDSGHNDARLISVPEEIYQRLSVAYGLSFHPFDIAEIRRQQEISDLGPEPQKGDYGENYIDKDQV